MSSSTTSTTTTAQLELFARGVVASLKQWTAYQIALDAAQRTDESPVQISTRLAEELLDAFDSGSATIDKLEFFLKEFVDVELDCLLEDDSEVALAKELTALWASTLADLAVAQQMVLKLEESAARKTKHQAVRQTRPEGDDESSSSSDEDSDEEDGEDVEMGTATSTSQASKRHEPVIDEDGFETVQRRKR